MCVNGPEIYSPQIEFNIAHLYIFLLHPRFVLFQLDENFIARAKERPLLQCLIKFTSQGVFPTPFRIRNEAATISSNSIPTGFSVSPPNPICFNLSLSCSENATDVRGSANGFKDSS